MAFDFGQLMQLSSFGFIFFFMFFGQKIQAMSILAQIAGKLKKLQVLRDAGFKDLRTHLLKHIAVITPEQEKSLQILIGSIAIPPVSNLDPAGIVQRMENIFKTYEIYLKNGLRRIVNVPGLPGESISQSDLENLTNSMEVAIELNVFHKVVEHFYKQAKKGGMMGAYMLLMALPQLMEMAEALGAASGHFQSGLPIGDGFGPMVANRISRDLGADTENSLDPETSVKDAMFEGRHVIVVKAKGPGGSVGNPGKVTQDVIQMTQPSLVVTIDAALRMESETTGDVAEGVGVAMGGPGMDRYRIEEALAKSNVPVLTIVCKMSMKEAISQMPKEVLAQVDLVYVRVFQIIRENSKQGDSVVVLGVGNTMGVE
jgi:hypothetical protein